MNKVDIKQTLESLPERMIAEVRDNAIVLLDVAGTILSWHKGGEKIKGYKPGGAIGQNFNNFLYAT
jgi:PAS domain S-box-containing protein